MENYTFIMEFRAGTYIAQHTANSIDEAVTIWAKNLDTKQIMYLGEKTKKQFLKELPSELKEFPPAPVATVQNVWFTSFLFKTGYARVNIIKTV